MALLVALLFSYQTQQPGFEIIAQNSLSTPISSQAVQDKNLQQSKTDAQSLFKPLNVKSPTSVTNSEPTVLERSNDEYTH